MFCMCIDRGCGVRGESKLCYVCLLTEGALIQGEEFMFCMCIDRECFGTRESKLCSLCVLILGALVEGRVSYVHCVY